MFSLHVLQNIVTIYLVTRSVIVRVSEPISARLRSSIKMAERPMDPYAFNSLTSFYKNYVQKSVKNCVCKQIIWFYYGTSELKEGNKFSASAMIENKGGETIIDQTWLYGKKKLFFSIRQQ